MTRVLHVLPHPGGGAETYLELLAGLPGYTQDRLELTRSAAPRSALPALARSWPALARRAQGSDILHAHGDAAALVALPLLRGHRSVWTTHGLHLVRRRPRLARAIRAVVQHTNLTICTSRAEARDLEAIAPQLDDRLLVVPNGIALPPPPDPRLRSEARAQLGLAAHETAAVYVGELDDRKRPLDAVAAAQAARAAGDAIVLLLAGSGPLAEGVGEQASDAVRPLGYCEDVAGLLNACDIFILPSAREGLSFALLQAMGHGLPVVVADGAGNAEAVGSVGIVVPVGDRAALADALRELSRDPARRAALGTAARARVAHEFPLQRLLDGVRAAYEQTLAPLKHPESRGTEPSRG